MDVGRSYCRSLDERGFEHVVLVPTHGGNFAPVDTVAREIDANVVALADLSEYMERQNEGLLRTDELEPGYEGEVSAARLLGAGFASVAENGVLGDPRKGTAEAGEEIFEAVSEAYAERVEAEREAV